MKCEPRPAIHMEKPQLRVWMGLPVVGRSLRIFWAGRTVLARVSDLYPPAGSVALWLCGGRAQKSDSGLCPPFCLGGSCPPAPTLMPDTSVPPCMLLVPFKLLPRCWSLEGVSLSEFMCGLFNGNCLGLQKFLPLTQSLLFLQPEKLW